MKSVLALTVVSLLVATAKAESPQAGKESVTVARERLEAARMNLAKAVQRIEKDPPSNEDLEAAHTAVGVLKDAIDAGAEREPQDLDYAKAALAARKELRTSREYVDRRRANVHIYNARREIDGLLKNLIDGAHRLEGKAPTSKDFAEARAAAAALRKSVHEAQSFAKEDQNFATYIAEVETNLTRQENGIDERWAQLSVEKQQMILEERRQALAASMAKINKDASDVQFNAADRAASELSKCLEEGRGLEAKDKTYRSNAERARAELVQGTRRMAELLSEVGLARVKSEVEPALKDLVAAGKALRSKKPTDDQVAEARTAAIVVRKLIEKFQPQMSRSPVIGQYVSEVKKTLIEVEVELQHRNLDSAEADLVKALKNIERRAATDEDFERVNAAIGNLEKTLQTTPTREPALAKPVADARTLLRSAPTAIAKRRLEIDVQRQRAKVDEAKRHAAALINEIQKTEVGEEQLRAAENGVKQLDLVLAEGVPLTRKDGEYASYAREVKKQISDLNERIARRRVALAVREGRALLSETITRAKTELEAAQRPDAKDPDIDTATQSVEAVNQAIEARTSLEKQDKGYAAQADRSRDQLIRLREALDLAKQARVLRRKTVETLAAGASADGAAAAARDLRTQKDYYEKALAQFRACADEGESMVKTNPALERVAVVVDGRPSTPKDVIGLCSQRTEVTTRMLEQVKGRIRFEEGAKRAFETGQALLAQSKKSEAASQFSECYVEAMIVQNQHPELKDSVFEVAGTRTTLAALIQECVKQKKLIEPRKRSP